MKNLILVTLLVIIAFGTKLNAQTEAGYGSIVEEIINLENVFYDGFVRVFKRIDTISRSYVDKESGFEYQYKIDTSKIKASKTLKVKKDNEVIIHYAHDMFSITISEKKIVFSIYYDELTESDLLVDFKFGIKKFYIVNVGVKGFYNEIIKSQDLACMPNCDRADLLQQYKAALQEGIQILWKL